MYGLVLVFFFFFVLFRFISFHFFPVHSIWLLMARSILVREREPEHELSDGRRRWSRRSTVCIVFAEKPKVDVVTKNRKRNGYSMTTQIQYVSFVVVHYCYYNN